MKGSVLYIMCALLYACASSQTHADQAVFGKIWTGNTASPWAEGFAIIDDTISAVGTREQIGKWIGAQTERIEASPGNLIVPGFIDCHTHFIEGGFALTSVQLRDARTPGEFITRIRDYALTIPEGAWITSGDWDHENWGGELPTRHWIDSVTEKNPVWINRLDGHMCLANSLAIQLAGVGVEVRDIPGGSVVHDQAGKPTGIFKDNAMSLVSGAVPEPNMSQKEMALEAAMDYVASQGVTSVHHMSGFMEVFEKAHREGKLKTRIYAGAMLGEWKHINNKIKEHGKGDNWLRIGCLKDFVDGSLGSHTAAFFEPFSDTPQDSGFFVQSPDDLYRAIKAADGVGLQVMIHAIGDKAIHTLLNIYEQVAEENGALDRRFRIEHAQHIHPNDIPRFNELQIIASMQPYHAIDDGRWAEKVIGYERCKTTYAFRSLLDDDATLAFGSDWFVAPPVPLLGIDAAVTRRTLDERNPDGWVPEQRITVAEALRAYTLDAAFASFEENIKGSLECGKLADFVILEKDITAINPAEIRDVKVLMTVVGGKKVYETGK